MNYSMGYSIGYIAVLRPNLVNNFRYGYTRESFGQIGNQTQDVIYFRGLNDDSSSNNSSRAVTNSSNYQVPVHNFVEDRKSTRLNSSHVAISYAVFCLKKKI